MTLVTAVAVGACGYSGYGTFDTSTVMPIDPNDGGPRASLPEGGSSDAAALDGSHLDSAPPVPACTDQTLLFDGVDDFGIVPDDPALDLGDDFTVEAWIKPGAKIANGLEMDVVSHHDPNASQGWALIVHQGHVEIVVFGNETLNPKAYSAGNAVGPAYVLPNQWAHIAGTKSGDTLRVYYNGVLRDTQAISILFGRDSYRGSLRIGRAAGVDDLYYQGEIDDVRLSKIARYTGATAPKPVASLSIDDQTVASWTFDEAAGTKLRDGTTVHDGSYAPDATAPMRLDSECIEHR